MFGGINPMYANQPQAAMMGGGAGAQPQAPQGGSAVDPALMQMVLAQQQQLPEQQRIQRQQKLADTLRADAAGGMQGIQAGRRYVGPGMANLAGNIGQSFMAAHQGQQAEQAGAQLGTQNAAAMGGILDYLKGQGRRDPRASMMPGGGGGGDYGMTS